MTAAAVVFIAVCRAIVNDDDKCPANHQLRTLFHGCHSYIRLLNTRRPSILLRLAEGDFALCGYRLRDPERLRPLCGAHALDRTAATNAPGAVDRAVVDLGDNDALRHSSVRGSTTGHY